MIVVAARDIKAGELVIKEKEPIMCITQADREYYRNVDPAMEIALAGYDVFKRILTDEHRQKFFTLYGPTTGVVADNLRKFLSKNARIRFGPEETYKGLSTEEIEIMVKVLQVARLNMFGTEGEDYKRFSDIMSVVHANVEPIYQEVLQLQLPVHHAASLPLLRVKWRALHTLNLANRSRYVSKLQDAMLECIRAIEGIITYPGSNLSDELTLIVAHCSKVCLEPVFPLVPEKELCLKALRMHLLLDGRSTRDAILDEVMLKCHEKLPSA
eukprot:gene18938-21545_t